ncbi:MAG: hypothetical protein AB4040_04725, partial [Synechococcus sp.]
SPVELQERGFRVAGDVSGDRVGKRKVEQQALSVRSPQSGDFGALLLEKKRYKPPLLTDRPKPRKP